MAFSNIQRRKRIKNSIRKKIFGTTNKPRLSVFRSNKGIYAQLIDDTNGHTIVSANYRETGMKGTKVEQAEKVGQLIADKAKKSKIEEVLFDRNGYQYHGRIAALADGARKNGLKF